MGYLAANLALLARKQPELARLLSATSPGRVELLTSACGQPTARYLPPDGRPVQLHSRHDPLKEARNVVRHADVLGVDYMICLGFGLGYVADALVELEVWTDRVLFVVERELDILRAAFESRDLKSVLSMRGTWFAWPASGPELAAQWARIFDPVTARKAGFVRWPPSLALAPDFYRSATEVIQSQIAQIFTDINTLVARSEMFLDNFVRNLPEIVRAPGVRHVEGRFAQIPAVIVSAGPSLDRNIHELRGREDGVLILATDTALKPLLAAGVQPHFICTADPSYENYRHLEGSSCPHSVLVAEATSHPGSVRDFSGRIFACTFENSSLHRLNDVLGDKGHLRAWGSVATMVLDFALKAGCDPIIFVGQDLAFTDGRLYGSGVYFEEGWFADLTTPEAWRERLREFRAAKKTLKMTDIFGDEVETSTALVSYWNWFQKELPQHADRTFVNATEGGILGGGIRIMSLREALFRFGGEIRDLRDRVRRCHAEAQRDPARGAPDALSRLLGDCDGVFRAVDEGLRRTQAPDPPQAAPSMAELESMKESIYAAASVAPTLDSFNQLGNVSFLRGRAALMQSGNAPEARAVCELYAAYFRSVRQAAEKLRAALEQIRGVLADPQQSSGVRSLHPLRACVDPADYTAEG